MHHQSRKLHRVALRILEKQPYETETADADEQSGAMAWIHGSKTRAEKIKTPLARILSSGGRNHFDVDAAKKTSTGVERNPGGGIKHSKPNDECKQRRRTELWCSTRLPCLIPRPRT